MNSRRKFIQSSAFGIAGSLSLPLIGKTAAQKNNGKKEASFKIGMAGYTFAKVDLSTAINMMKRVNVHYLSVKEMQLPLNSSPGKIKEVLAQFSAADIKPYAAGVIYMKTKDEVDKAFDYAKAVGVDMIVGVPTYELLDYTEEKIKSYNIKVAVHNHGPEDKLYPGPKDVYEHIQNRDERMGLCLDIGHAQRTGVSPADAVKQFGKRIFDLHIKDVTAAQKDGKAIEIGRGIIDFDALIKALEKINYKGVCSIEYEKDMSDPLPGIAESVGFFKGVISGVS